MTNDRCTCTVEVSPDDEIDAGAGITLNVRVECPREDALRTASVSVRDQAGAELARAALKTSDSGTYEADDIAVPAPRVAGDHVYRAVVLATGKDGALNELASTDVPFSVKPHTAQLNVWDVPSAIVAREPFKFTVGVRCSAGCPLHGQALSILNQEGAPAGVATPGPEVWPGTEALYFAEIEAEAPAAPGVHQWKIKTAEWDLELPHATSSVAVALRVVSAPDCEVTVEVVDRETQGRIEGATVVMHPYRATTGGNGIATLKVTKGPYDIFVSGPAYVSACLTAEVTADMVTRAELDAEPSSEPIDE